jgi:signal transduction histidine kinase
VGVMVLQAGAAQALRADRPDRSHQAVATIQVAAADALDQLDRLVALLEAGTVGTAGLATPTAHTDLADDLARLAGRMRTAGMVVDIHMVGDMPTDTARCVTIYRIVQEALTNAMRHASGSQVTITLRSGDGYELEIEDDGPHGDVVASSAGGFGLAGLAERVEALGGQFTAGPRPDGGFYVRAWLPAAAPAEASS